MSSPIHTWSVAELVDGFRTRRTSPIEALDALIARRRSIGAGVNAFTDVYDDEARADAERAAQRYDDGTNRPLEGVPLAIKDESGVAGKRTTNGSLLWLDWIAERDDPIVERLRANGAIIYARTTTPEFSATFWTHSAVWGITRNPWNPAYDVGGSSGGSAAAVAAGLVPLATGSDIGGSIRQPASCCGVVGWYPPHGRIPVAPPYHLDTWSHVGPIARTVRDIAMVSDLLIGRHPDDVTSLPADPIGEIVPDVRGMRIALSVDLGDFPVTDEVKRVVRSSAAALADAGAEVVELTPADLTVPRGLLATTALAHYRHGFAADLAASTADERQLLQPASRYWIDWVMSSGGSHLDDLMGSSELQRRVGAVLARFDALLCPTMAVPAFRAGVDHTQEPFRIDGVVHDTFTDVALTEVFNAIGRCPVLAVPAGRSADGVPIGLQVVAAPFDDRTAFRVAATLERVRPWPLVAPLDGGQRSGTR